MLGLDYGTDSSDSEDSQQLDTGGKQPSSASSEIGSYTKKGKNNNKEKKKKKEKKSGSLLPSASDALSNAVVPAFITKGLEEKQAQEKQEQYERARREAERQAREAAVAVSFGGDVTGSCPRPSLSILASEAGGETDKKKLTTRQRNNLQEKRGQAIFTVKDSRECPDIWRGGESDAGSGRKRGFAQSLSEIDIAGYQGNPNNKKIKAIQKNKVMKGQSFEGRTWKSEGEMLLRQQYDG